MKKKLLLFLTVAAALVCLFAISASAVTPNNDGEVFVATDGTTLALYDTDGKALAWFYDSATSQYVPYRVGIDFTMALNSSRELLPATVISDTDGDENTTFPYTVSNMILINGRDYSAFTYISGSWKDLPIQAIYVNNAFRWINKESFNNNVTLRVFDIPKDHSGTLHIGPAFVRANALESFYVPKDAYFEGSSTFEYSTGIKSVEFHKEWTGALKGYEFNGCTALKTVILADTITVIPTATFRDCSSLASITLPSGLTTIYGGANNSNLSAFRNCSALKAITIPATVTFIGGYTFAGSGLETITFEPRTLEYDEDGKLTNGLNMGEYAVFENCKSLTELILPEGLTKIGNCFAKGCSALTRVSLPSTLKETDGSQQFYSTALTEVIGLENTQLTYLPSEIFRGVKSWKPEVLKLPNTCKKLSSYALADVGMKTLYLGASFEGVEGNHPLTGCSSLKTIYAPASATGLSLGNSGTTLVLVTTTDETAISAISTSTGVTQIMTLAQYKAGEYSSGKCIITGYNICDAFYGEHLDGGEETGKWTGDKFLSNYMITCPCERECGVETVIKDLAPLFTSKGFAASGDAMMQAFAINQALWESEYQALFPELKYGMVAAFNGANEQTGFDTTSGKILNADGIGINSKVAVVDMTERGYDVFEIKIAGVGTDEYKATSFFLCAYVVLDGQVYYLNNGTTSDAATGVCHNDVADFTDYDYIPVSKEENENV